MTLENLIIWIHNETKTGVDLDEIKLKLGFYRKNATSKLLNKITQSFNEYCLLDLSNN